MMIVTFTGRPGSNKARQIPWLSDGPPSDRTCPLAGSRWKAARGSFRTRMGRCGRRAEAQRLASRTVFGSTVHVIVTEPVY